jgi:hypothetical protein
LAAQKNLDPVGATANRNNRARAHFRHVANASVAFLFACGGSMPEPSYSSQPVGAFEEVPYAQPPARVELVPERPKNPGAVWVDGEWDWTGARWAWQYGRWVVPPAGATYSKWAVIRRSDGVLLFAPGVFRDRKGAEVPSPPSIAVARARDEDIVDAEGRTERTAPNVRPEVGTPPASKP